MKPTQVYISNYQDLMESFPENGKYKPYDDILTELQLRYNSAGENLIPEVMAIPYREGGWAMFDLAKVTESGAYYEFKDIAH